MMIHRYPALDVNRRLDTTQTRRIHKLHKLAESCTTGTNDEIRKDTTNELERRARAGERA